MSQQLVLSINSDADNFRWCWLSDGQIHSSASGNLEALAAALDNAAQQVWLLVPGAKVVTRQLEYTEKEKKHLRNLLPFQLEESVVGDIEDLHVAIGTAAAGKVTLAYTDKRWLKSVFSQLAAIGIEITRCWSTPSLLPLQVPPQELLEPVFSASDPEPESALPASETPAASPLAAAVSPVWALALDNGQVNLRFAEQQGFSIPLALLAPALERLVETQKLGNNLPALVLRASHQAELDALLSHLPANLSARVSAQWLVEPWHLDFNGRAIDLCQADFSQRLPLERWLKLWRGVGILALVTFITYVGVLGFHIFKLNKENLQLRQQMEAAYRSVVPNGQSDDPEKRLRLKLQQLQPKAQTGSVVETLARLLPIVASDSDVSIKVISYSAESGEMSVSVQAHSFNSIDALRQTISSQGYNAELQGVNVQGELNSGRLKITKQQ